ncbi:hypothetical protein OROMI_002873 [Orobanche minor]
MGQQSLIYSFVARGTVILAEFMSSAEISLESPHSASRNSPPLTTSSPTSAMATPSITLSRMDLVFFTIDPRTRMILNKMHNRGEYSNINGCISTGKELMCIMPQKVMGGNWLSKFTKLLFLYLSMSTNTSASFSDLMLLLCSTIFGGTYDGVWYDTVMTSITLFPVESYNLIINQWS